VKLLLDTCTFLWIITDDSRLSPEARSLFADPENDVYLKYPFDPILICQAIVGGLCLLTPDPLITQYPVHVAW